MKQLSCLSLLLVLLLAACNGSGTDATNTNATTQSNNQATATDALAEERTFPNNVWNSKKSEVFNINVKDSNAFYTITYTVALDTAIYRYETFPFYTDIYTPDGTHRHLTPEFQVKQYGRWKGEDRDGYRVITKQLFEYFSFNKAGKQRIEVKQATSQYNLEGVHAFSIKIQKANLDFEKMRNGNK